MDTTRLRRTGAIIASAALFASLTVATVAAPATANHAWGSYHWEGPLVTEVAIASNLDSRWSAFLTGAKQEWGTSVLELKPATAGGKKNCGAVEGQVEVCNDEYGYRQGGWLGVATIWASGPHITQATVQLNDTFLFGNGRYDSDDWREMVMCHEIGHTFGLDHRDENFNNTNKGSCLDYTLDPDGSASNPPGPSNLKPDAHDLNQLKAIYDHNDSSSGGGGDDGGDNDCNPRSPKCDTGALKAPPFSQASRANGDVYVDQLRNGLTRIKHVFWVPRR